MPTKTSNGRNCNKTSQKEIGVDGIEASLMKFF
jgi:hypothetical protein